MEYKVVPIVPIQKEKETNLHIAQELESIIKKYTDQGYEYVRVESLKTWINGKEGCFGVGAIPGNYSEKQFVVFKK